MDAPKHWFGHPEATVLCPGWGDIPTAVSFESTPQLVKICSTFGIVLLATDNCQKRGVGGRNHTRSCHKNSWAGGGVGFCPIFDSSSAKWSLDSQQKPHTNTWCVCCSLDIYKPTVFHCSGRVAVFVSLLEKLMLSIEVVAYLCGISFPLLQKSFF